GGFERVASSSKHPVILVYQDAPSEARFKLIKNYPFLNHIIPLKCENTRQLLARLSSGSAFSPSLFQPLDLSEKHEKNLTDSGDCEDVYDEVAEFAQSLGCFQGFESIVRTASSELLSNAFYNGKRNPKTGEALVSDRRIKFALDKGESIGFTY